jgi:hypothetical protein
MRSRFVLMWGYEMETVSITVLDRAGTHTGVWTPPASKQPAKGIAMMATPSRFDRSAIMRAAWIDYRAAVRKSWTCKGFDAARWSYCLSFAWSLAKARLIRADSDAKDAIRLQAIISAVSVDTEPPMLADPAKQALAEAIRAELQVIEYSDALDVPTARRELALQAELGRLMA